MCILAKRYDETRKNVKKQNCSPQKDLRIFYRTFFIEIHIFFSIKNYYKSKELYILANFILTIFWKNFVFILIKRTLKIKSDGFRSNNARYGKMLTSKIVHLKKIYNFYFDHFLIKRTVFVLIVKNVIKKSKIQFSEQTLQHTKQMLSNKIGRFKKIYKF